MPFRKSAGLTSLFQQFQIGDLTAVIGDNDGDDGHRAVSVQPVRRSLAATVAESSVEVETPHR